MTTWYVSNTSPSGANNVAMFPSDERSTFYNSQLESRSNSRMMKLPLGPSGTGRRSINLEKTSPVENKGDFMHGEASGGTGTYRKLIRLPGGNSRFPRVEDMPHFHYDFVDLGEAVKVCLYTENGGDKRYYNGNDEEAALLINVICRGKSWILTRTIDNLRLLDRALHRCLFDRNHSKLRSLSRLPDYEEYVKSQECRQLVQEYLARFSQLADDVMNCSAVLNWLELDNHGNHMLLTDDSPINVPGIAAAHVIKRYTAQAVDEISLEVGGIISVIDMPPVDESLWWRGKQGFEVGFFPSQCVEVIVAKKRGKIVSFLRLFLSSRPSKARLMQSGILKERTFGCDLGEHLAKTNHQVPQVLMKCAEVIEKNGIVDGIYRLSGMSSNIQKLRLAFDGDEPPDLLKDCYIRDIHCISSLLKMYFRELPNPLLTYHLYDKFVAAIQITDESERQIAIHHVVQQLPPPHYRTLEYLFTSLVTCRLALAPDRHARKNLAIVWSPNLLRPMSMDSGGAALLQVNVQAVIIEYLIRNAHVFLTNKRRPPPLWRTRVIRPALGTDNERWSPKAVRRHFMTFYIEYP
ncbi:Rho GTPase-activating protein 32 [Desmophyllum pertusum]|uniref:Rho GTPase-activating protein 32 n=1 Tax=Desmophyllum pertusum TaxID=174260 RepID=A0A9W9Z4Z9_9CNID|nr:Rho GTPase-activating protein 32 [Desmophyllum pertusum]